MTDLKQYPTRSKIHRFWLRIRKQIFVPENHLVPVKRDSFYHRLLEPGYNTFWLANEELCKPIDIGIRVAEITAYPVQTKDCDQIMLDVTARYKFDPRTSDPEVISWIVNLSPRKIRIMVEAKLGEAIQAVCGQYNARELASGKNWSKHSRSIQLYLNRKMEFLGISFPLTDSVVIKKLQLSRRTEEGFEDGVSAAIHGNLTDNQNQTLIKREAVRSSDSVRFSYFESDSHPPNVVIDMPYNEPIRPKRKNGRTHA